MLLTTEPALQTFVWLLSISETKSLYVWLSLMSGFELIHRALPASEMASTFFFFQSELINAFEELVNLHYLKKHNYVKLRK